MTGAMAGALWSWRPIGRVEVVGESMLPTLAPGDRLLVLRAGRPRPGDVVAVTDPTGGGRTLVKRLVARGPEGLTVLGDNAGASTDSRQWGPVAEKAVRGRVFYRYHPDERRGLLYPGG